MATVLCEISHTQTFEKQSVYARLCLVTAMVVNGIIYGNKDVLYKFHDSDGSEWLFREAMLAAISFCQVCCICHITLHLCKPYWKCCACSMHVTHTLHAYMTVTLMLHACTMSVYMTWGLQKTQNNGTAE